MSRISKALLYGAAIFAAMALTANATDSADVPPCYDAIVSARLVKLFPSEIPDCGENCIVMVWPWFADLKVERVLKGRVPTPRLSVLTMLHSYLAPRSFNWSLRRNKEGGFNAQPHPDKDAVRCPSNAEPAEPYLRPGAGQTLDELRQTAEREHDKQ